MLARRHPKAKVAEFIDFSGYKYEKDTFMK